MMIRWIFACLITLVISPCLATAADAPRTEHLILITLDGMRTQELFGGADKTLMNGNYGGVRDLPRLNERYWRETPQERREALMPFMWNTIAKQGQIFGDREQGSPVTVTNRRYFSYPGYNEILAGFADIKIDSNDKKYNENTTVLEFLHQKDRFKGRVEAYTGWDVFPYIINSQRSGIPVNSGFDPPYRKPADDRQRLINATAAQMPRVWGGVGLDAFLQYPAIDALREGRVSVLYIAYGETDDWAHDKRYDNYLDGANRVDGYLKELWDTVQSMEKYKGRTSLVITTDHGRGDNPANWTSHSDKYRTSEFIWIAVLGPDTPALGVRKDTPATQSQVAATAAHLLGEDFTKVDKRVAKQLDGVRD